MRDAAPKIEQEPVPDRDERHEAVLVFVDEPHLREEQLHGRGKGQHGPHLDAPASIGRDVVVKEEAPAPDHHEGFSHPSVEQTAEVRGRDGESNRNGEREDPPAAHGVGTPVVLISGPTGGFQTF